jgi:class 3 adenylate cyclase/putative methionine-R-sulfoxide reductase with GAF domain/tetratricopeptide (TPR) repeat protein
MHANTMIEPLMEAYRSGLMAGNLFSGNWVACYALTWKYFTGQPLGSLQSELNSFTGSFRQLKQFGAFNLADILLHTVNRLTDPDAVNAVLGNDQIDEEGILQRCFDAHDKTAVFFLHLNRMQLNYLFGDYKKARSSAKDAEAYLEAVIGLHYIPLYHFYRSLIILADPESEEHDLKSVKGSMKKMKLWAKHAPQNYLHKYHLIEAEWAVRQNDHENARKAFDNAIILSRENNFLQEEAIALERASFFYSKLNIPHLSHSLHQEMIRNYSQWGASAKLRQLGVKNSSPEKSNTFTGISSRLTTDDFGPEMLDMESVLKASAMLAGEIDPDRLIPGFMRIMMENSGADRGVLILNESDGLHLRAGVSVNSGNVEMVDIPVNGGLSGTAYSIPQSVVRFAMNTLKVVIINDTARDHEFKKDSYFMVNQVKALTCFPILNQNKLVGVVYLENSLLQDVFSEERKEVLNIIGSQFAVTLENIRLYQHTQLINRAYERFVPKQFLAYLNKDNIIDVELGDHIQREMTICFLDIRGFTGLSEQMTPQENFFFINEFLGVMEPVVMKYGGFIDKYIGDAIMAIFPDSVDRAIEAGSEMLTELERFNSLRISKNQVPIRIGIGMHTGVIMLGTIGGNIRMDTTVISDVVNIASRVEGLNKEYGTAFLVTEATLNRSEFPGAIQQRKIGEVPIRGKEQRITIYEVQNVN